MYNIDLIVFIIMIVVLFARQVMKSKHSNKIDFAPIIIVLGIMSSIVHIILYPEVQDIVSLFRESLYPLLIALFLYIALNIFNQIQDIEIMVEDEDFEKKLVQQVFELKDTVYKLDLKLVDFFREERSLRNDQDNTAKKLLEDIKIFLEKFDALSILYEDVSLSFRNFTEVQMPELDSVVHKHIDILRISNQDQYNHLKNDLHKIVENKKEMINESKNFQSNLTKIQQFSTNITDDMNKSIAKQLLAFKYSLESEIGFLQQNSEQVTHSLDENKLKLQNIKELSELFTQKISFISIQMKELAEDKENILNLEVVKDDYLKAQIKLEIIANDFKLSEGEQLESMKQQMEFLSESLNEKIDNSLSKLHEHYHIADDNISQSVQILSKQAKLQNEYGQFES